MVLPSVTKATYLPGKGVLIDLAGNGEGLSVLIPPHFKVATIERYVRELLDFLA